MSKKEKLIGKTIEEAIEILRNCEWRIVKENDNDLILTQDLNPNRFNLYLEKGIIIDVKFF
jgi:hypothetical protein